jgi:hypothetical protein
MGFDITDLVNKADGYSTNHWNWHSIVDVISSLEILPGERIESLHNLGEGLTAEEARIVAAEVRTRILPKLDKDSRVLADGSIIRSDKPDNGLNGVSLNSLGDFVAYCERSNGFVVW